MFLRALTLKGFKSFAEPTTLEFERGLTAVVGPNGSGKSNIVDAVAWVLGAQSARSLRSGRMDDVVFAGNGSRPPLGRAEVSLTIDNAAGLLPIDFSEVTVTRTLFRTSGESEYAINGVPCRLLDVAELLSDAGVGRQQHVIVSQGHLSSVLEARPEERRLIVEEAAGILKFRRRKEKAERRLAATEANLERLVDLTREVRRQIAPLQRQADAAHRHHQLTAELGALRLHLLGRRLARYRTGQAEAAAEGAELAAAGERLRLEMHHLDGRITALDALLASDAGSWLGQAAGRMHALTERGRGLAAVLVERATGMERMIDSAADPGVLKGLESEAALLAEELVAVGRAEADLADAEATQAAAEADLADDQDRLALLSEAEYAARQLSEARGELAALQAALLRRGEEAATLAHALEGAGTAQVRARGDAARAGQALAEAAAGVESATAIRLAADHHRDRCGVEMKESERALSEATVAEATGRGRLEVLARQMAAADSGAEVAGALGGVLSCVEIEPGWEAAVEAALAPCLGGLVIRDADHAAEALSALAETVLVVASGGPGPNPAGEPPPHGGLRGRVVPAPHLDARSREAVAEMLDRLIGPVALAGSAREAVDLVRSRPELVAVTPEGGRFGPWSWQARSSRRSLAAAAAEARRELEAASGALDQARRRAAAARAALESARSASAEAAEALEAARREAAERRAVLVAAEREEAHAAAAVGELTERAERLRRQGDGDVARLQELERLLAEAGDPAQELRPVPDGDRLFTDLRQARHLLAGRANTMARRRAELAARSAELVERRSQLERQLGVVEQRLLRERSEATIAAAREGHQRQVLDRTRRLAAHLQERLAEAEDHARGIEDRLERHAQRRRERTGELDGLRRERAAAEDRREQLRQRRSRAELAQAEASMRIETTVEIIRSELESDPDTALVAECPPLEHGVTAAQRLREVENEIRGLGPVNPLATEELAALEERHEFLAAQLDDVKRSRRELAKVIRAVDEEMTTRLAAAMADVVENFSALFETLFPGGSGRLVVTDPDDLLGSGLEIEARPSGKRARRLSLLSGGERSLCALAFHFAVFRSRPSPFYLLDEVEAALDDVNLQRFIRLLEEFRSSSQLLVVTHQKRTMEAADSLYGVTMAPGGSSRVVSERLQPPARSPVLAERGSARGRLGRAEG